MAVTSTTEQDQIDDIVKKRDKKLEIVARVSPTLNNSESYKNQVQNETVQEVKKINPEKAEQISQEPQSVSQPENTDAEIQQQRQLEKQRELEKIENEKNQRLAALGAEPSRETEVPVYDTRADGTQYIKYYRKTVTTSSAAHARRWSEDRREIIRDASVKTQRVHLYYSDIDPAAKQKALKQQARNPTDKTNVVTVAQNFESNQKIKQENQRRTDIQSAESAAIIESENRAIELSHSDKQKQREQKDIDKVNASLAPLGITTDDLTKSGESKITFRASTEKPEPPKTTEEKSKQILENAQAYKDGETDFTKPNASNYMPIDPSTYNATDAAQPAAIPNTRKEIQTEKSEQILNQYFLYKHGFTDLTDDVASDGKPRTLPTPKKENVQNDVVASKFYQDWVDRYGALSKDDLESTGIFSDPEKLQRVKELNMQRKNMPIDPAVIVLKESIDKISQVNANKEAKAAKENEIPADNGVRIVRDGLIVVKNERYSAIQTPKYTRIVVYPTEDKDGYVQILSTSQQSRAQYSYDENLTEQERQIKMWQTTNFLLSQEAKTPTEADKKINQYLQENRTDIIAAESDKTKQGDATKLSDNDFLDGLFGHSTELLVAGQSAYTEIKGEIEGTKREDVEKEIFDFQNKMNYSPTIEAALFNDVIEGGKNAMSETPQEYDSQTAKVLQQNSIGKSLGSITGSIITAAFPVGKIATIIKPITKLKTAGVTEKIAQKTIPDGVAYSVEVDKDIPSRAIVWVGSEESTKQTIRTRQDTVVADVESGTGRASFDVIKVDTKNKSVEFIKIAEAADKEKIISEIRLESRGTNTAKDLDLKQYDTQGKFEYSQGTTNFENIAKLFDLEKQKEVKQVATGTKRPLEDVETNPEIYGDKPTYSTTDDAAKRFDQFTESLEGGKEPRISGRVGYFLEKPADGNTQIIKVNLPDDVLAELQKPEPLGLQARAEQRARQDEIFKEYFNKNQRIYVEKNETPQSKPQSRFQYDDVESELKKLARDSDSTKKSAKTSAETQTKESASMSEIKNLLANESRATSQSSDVVLPKAKPQTKTKVETMPKMDTSVDVLENQMSSTMSKMKLKLDGFEDVMPKQKPMQMLDEDLELPQKLLTDNPVMFDYDYDFVPRLLQRTEEIPPEKLIYDLPLPKTPNVPRTPFIFLNEDLELDEIIPYKKTPSYKRAFTSNIPYSPFGTIGGYDELTYGKTGKIDKLVKRMFSQS